LICVCVCVTVCVCVCVCICVCVRESVSGSSAWNITPTCSELPNMKCCGRGVTLESLAVHDNFNIQQWETRHPLKPRPHGRAPLGCALDALVLVTLVDATVQILRGKGRAFLYLEYL
jgi:hypothetical protein